MTIRTSGSYGDRWRGGVFLFRGPPSCATSSTGWRRRSRGVGRLSAANDTAGFVEVDGRIDTNLSAAYFEPTPFSQWQIAVPDTSIDLTNVECIVMELAGWRFPRVA